MDNNVDDLIYKIKINYQDLFLDKCWETIPFYNKNIFKFSDGSYLLKYPLNELTTRLNNGDMEIINIIKINYLNKIFIIRKDNIDFIFLYQPKNIPLIYVDDYDCDDNENVSERKITVKDKGIYTVSSFYKDYKYYDC